VFDSNTKKGEDFLEATPYYDTKNIPLNTYKNKEPHTGKVVSVKRIVGEWRSSLCIYKTAFKLSFDMLSTIKMEWLDREIKGLGGLWLSDDDDHF